MSDMSQSPQTGQFNSYPLFGSARDLAEAVESQSPQTGQFNSYLNQIILNLIAVGVQSLNPLKRVNSILT